MGKSVREMYENPDPVVIPDEPDVDFLVEGTEVDVEPTPDPERVKLEQEVEQMRSQLESTTSRADEVQALRQGIVELKENLQVPTQPQGRVQQQRGESEDDFKKRINEKFYDDPFGNLQEVFRRQTEPIVLDTLSRLEKQSRRLIVVDPERNGTFKKYMPEIDAEVQKMTVYEKAQADDVYTAAHDRVISRHIGDLMEETAKKAVAEYIKQVSDNNETTRPTPTPTGPINNTPSPTPTRKIQIKVTREEEQIARREAMAKFGSEDLWRKYLRHVKGV